MPHTDPEAPLPTGSWEATPEATEAFELLGNDTRLGILLALWEELDPLSDERGVSFSTLRERVGVRDSGQFNYHLKKLQGTFLRQEEHGYVFMPVGLQLVQTVVAGTGSEASMDPTEIGVPCPRCGGVTAMSYQNGWLFHHCLECDESLSNSFAPPGGLFGEPFSPAALADRSAEELFAAGIFKLLQVMTMKVGGLCPRCDGGIETILHPCPEHDAEDGPCTECGRRRPVLIRWLCPVCKFVGSGSPGGIAMLRPETVAFYQSQGIELADIGRNLEAAQRVWRLMNDHSTQVVTHDPLRIQVTATAGDASLTLLFDEDLNVRSMEIEDGSSA